MVRGPEKPRGIIVSVLLPACLSVVLAASGCGGGSGAPPGDPPPPPHVVTFRFDFADGLQEWVAGASDYPVGREADILFEADIRPLPAPLDTTRTGFYVSGLNISDDLFIFARRRVTGLRPNTTYGVRFRVTFATNAGAVGGDSMLVKTGASLIEPRERVVDLGTGPYYGMTVDKGGASTSGRDAIIVGDLARPDQTNPDFQLKTLENTVLPLTLRTDGSGTAWLLVGVDSAFEVTTRIQLTGIQATFTSI